jgi:hypothetical protein
MISSSSYCHTLSELIPQMPANHKRRSQAQRFNSVAPAVTSVSGGLSRCNTILSVCVTLVVLLNPANGLPGVVVRADCAILVDGGWVWLAPFAEYHTLG